MRKRTEDSSNKSDSDKPSQVRKIKPTRLSNSGHFPLPSGRSVAYESTLERDFLLRLSFFSSVVDIIAQPIEIPFRTDKGHPYKYTPDFLVYYRSDQPKPLLVEVKPERDWRAHWREWSSKWKAANRYAEGQGWSFRIFDEGRIRDQVLSNVMFLQRYKRLAFQADECALMLSRVRGDAAVRILDLLDSGDAPGHHRQLSVIWHLLAQRQLDCVMTAPLNVQTEVWRVDYA